MLSVLCVEDEPEFLAMSRLYLEETGSFAVECATSAEEALDRIKKVTYDAIVSDYQLPGVDGIEFLKILRSSGKTTPFIVFTGKGREEIVIQAYENGADFYLQKGGDPASQYAELIHRISQIVELRKAQKAEKDSELKIASIMDFLPDATFAINNEGVVIAWNHAVEEMTGVGATEIVGKGDFVYSVPFYGRRRPILIDLALSPHDEIKGMYGYVRSDGDRLIAETVNARPRGKEAVLWAKATPLFDTQGRRIGAIETVRDITMYKRAEEMAKESEAQFRTLVEHIPDLVIVQRDGIILYMNPAMEESMDYRTESAIGKPILDYIDPRYHGMVCDSIRKRKKGGNPEPYEVEVVARDGHLRTVIVRGAVIDYGGSPAVLNVLTDITQQKQFEKVLRESEEKYLNLIERANDGICIIQDGIVRHCNSRLAEFWGGTVVEIVGTDFRDFIDPCNLSGVTARYVQRMRGDTPPGVYEAVLVRKDGRPFDAEINAGLTVFEGNPADFIIIRDISARKQAEQALRESEERYRAVIEDQTEFICRFTPDGKLSFVNSAYCQYFGLDRTGCIGNPHNVVLPEGDKQLVKNHLAGLAPDKPVGMIEHPIVMPSGQVRWQRWSDRAIFDDNGHLLEYQSVGRDTTDQRRAAEELADSEAKYRSLANNIPGIVYRISLTENRMDFFNPEVVQLTGYTVEELTITGICSLDTHIVPEDRSRVNSEIASAIARNRPFTVEYRFRRKNGEIRTFIERGRPAAAHHGPVSIIDGVIFDITDQKRTEEALASAVKKLGLLTSITRHDILNKITVVIGYATLARESLPGPVLREYLEKLETAIKAIQSQIEFTRLYQDVGTNEPVWQILEDLMPKEQIPPGVKAAFDLGDVSILADPMIKKVFFNLLDNSIRHGQQVTTITVTCREKGKGLVIEWTDDGVGIPLDKKEKIFEPGYGTNTGLGMFLTREILSITDMAICENGEPDRGARFLITVPEGAWQHGTVKPRSGVMA